jgi:hypothetical protein
MVFLPDPPEVDKSLRLPSEMPAQLNRYLTFNRGGAYFSGVMLKKINLGISTIYL